MTQYVSITGLTVRSVLHAPRFWWHATRCYGEAQRAPGCLYACVREIRGVQHTLTAWESRTAAMEFVRSDTHVRAMKVFPKIATGRTIGFLSATIPDWTEAREIWERDGKDYRET